MGIFTEQPGDWPEPTEEQKLRCEVRRLQEENVRLRQLIGPALHEAESLRRELARRALDDPHREACAELESLRAKAIASYTETADIRAIETVLRLLNS